MLAAFNRRYGAHPIHLIGHLAAVAIAAFALDQIVTGGGWVNFAFFFLGGALGHDLVFLPFYTLLDRVQLRRLPPRDPPLVNHIRAPALISGVLLLIYAPLIAGLSEHDYIRATGHHVSGYVRNWLLVTVALFAGSGVVYAIRVLRRRR